MTGVTFLRKSSEACFRQRSPRLGRNMALDTINSSMPAPKRIRRQGTMCVNQPSACPTLFGMTGFTAFFKLVVVWVTVAFSTTDANTIENKLRALAGIRLGCMAILAWRIGMFAFEPKFAVAVMDEKKSGFLPAGGRVTSRTIGRPRILMWIRMAIRAGIKIKANVPRALMHAASAFLKVALVARQLAMLTVESEPCEIMIEHGNIKPSDVSVFS